MSVEPTPAELAVALDALPAEVAGAMRAALRELAELREVRETLAKAERMETLEGRLRVIADGVQRLGFGAVAFVLVSPAGVPEFIVANDGAPPNTPDVASRARLTAPDEPMDNAFNALAIPLATGSGSPIARLVLVRPANGYPVGREASLRLLGAEAARAIHDARIVEVAERRAARLQRLQEIGVQLARSLDERRILRELARHVQRMLPCRGVIVARPDVAARTVDVVLHVEGGTLRMRGAEKLGAGIIEEVARTARAVRIAEVSEDSAARAAVSELVGGDPTGIRSVLASPMLSQHRLVGVVAVYGGAHASYTTEDEELLGTLAAQAAAATVNARLYEESQKERRQSEALAEIARAVSGSLRVSEVLHLIQRHASAMLAAGGAMVAIRKGKFLHVVAATGSAHLLAGMYLPIEGSVTGRAVMTGKPVLSNDASSDPNVYAPARELARTRRALVTPLRDDEETIGALAVVDREAPFNEEDIRTLQRFGDQVAIALVNARLYEEAAEATRQLAVTFDAIASGLVVVDDGGLVVRCNARAAELLGAGDPAALVGTPFNADALDAEWTSEAGEPWPVARALAERTVCRAAIRSRSRGALYVMSASPHAGGGAVVSFDDVTSMGFPL